MQEPRFQNVLVGAGYVVVFGLVGLSMWAVGHIQLASRPEGGVVRYWYLIVFLGLEIWVALGLMVCSERFRQGRWGAGIVALAIWLAAMGLSAIQESRFHILFDSKVDALAAPVLAVRANTKKRVSELEANLSALTKPTRPVAAIEAELAGYEARRDASTYPTRITALRAELAAARSFEQMGADLVAERQSLVASAADAAVSVDAKKVGQSFSVFGVNVTSTTTVWMLIATMMAIKALGPWLLLGISANRVSSEPKTAQSEALLAQPPASESLQSLDEQAESAAWVKIQRPDRDGNMQTVRVARGSAS